MVTRQKEWHGLLCDTSRTTAALSDTLNFIQIPAKLRDDVVIRTHEAELTMTTRVTLDVKVLRQAIQERYRELAEYPGHTFHFHHGRPLAELLGYPADQLDALLPEAVESFAGVGNPFSVGTIESGETVLDVGSGGGFDCFIAAHLVGSSGKVIGVDMTDAMLDKAGAVAQQMGLAHVEFRQGLVEEMPVESGSIDVAISNGVINLCPDKRQVFREIFRVLKPGGRLCLSDIVVHRPVPDGAKANVDLWTA
jgi:arsenite methyltransferase